MSINQTEKHYTKSINKTIFNFNERLLKIIAINLEDVDTQIIKTNS